MENEMGETIMYGICDENGDSWLYLGAPFKESDDGIWNSHGPKMKLVDKNLFPKDKPVKFELRRSND
jgi:hypothetical protein